MHIFKSRNKKVKNFCVRVELLCDFFIEYLCKKKLFKVINFFNLSN